MGDAAVTRPARIASIVGAGTLARACSAGHIWRRTSRGTARRSKPPAALGLELHTLTRAAEVLEARISGLRAQALALAKGGAAVPGWAVERGPGRERWRGGRRARGYRAWRPARKDVRKPDAIVTPKQARKLGIDGAVISAYSEKPLGDLKLVEDNATKAARIFKP